MDQRDVGQGGETAPMTPFDRLVLSWLHDNGAPEAIEVVKVNGDGTDWEGSTEGGFYSRFGVEITYRTEAGTRHLAVVGDDMESLWEWVVKGYGEATDGTS